MHPKMKEMSQGVELKPAQRAKLDMLKELQKIANQLIAESSMEDEMSSEEPKGMAVMIAKKEEMSPEHDMEMESEMEDSEADSEEDDAELQQKLEALLKKKQSL